MMRSVAFARGRARPAVRVALVVLLLVLLLATAADLTLTLDGALRALNRTLTLDVYHLDPSWLTAPMVVFTLLGYDPPLDLFALAVAFWAYRRGERRTALLVAGVALIARLVAVAMKYVVRQPRPFLRVPPRPLTVLHGYGYPSGHAVLSLAILGFGAFVIVRLLGARPAGRLAALACAVLILLIGWSRVFLGFHWVNDVAGGYLEGALILVAASLIEVSR